MKKIGLIINPVAGMGGSVGLAGTDGVLEEAIARGAKPHANERAAEALTELLPIKDEIEILTCPGVMGQDLALAMGFKARLIDTFSAGSDATSRKDTIHAAECIANLCEGEEPPVLLIFAGGDGTARDVYTGAGLSLPCIGIPAGVKIHSPVYARNPQAAGELALRWIKQAFSDDGHSADTGRPLRLRELEVLDIDEDAYRREEISTKLFGYLNVPDDSRLIQNRKEPTPLSEAGTIAAIAAEVVDNMKDDTYYLIGAGTTTRGIMEELGLPNTLIGVDLVKNGDLVEAAVYGERILELIGSEPVKLVVTVTGGQGFLFGRGNQQLTPAVLRRIGKENIIIIATPSKLAELKGRPLLTDTGDAALDEELSGYYRAITGYDTVTMCKVAR